MSTLTCASNLPFTSHQYGGHALQRVGVWRRGLGPEPRGKHTGYWIIFIHGGAWRDPRNTLEDFIPSIRKIVSLEHEQRSTVCGFASIDYRLSPSPAFPQDPRSTPSDELRTARHPDHILDIHAALKLLEEEYQLANNYILVGHSAGATLAFQLLMGGEALCTHQIPYSVPLPAAVIAIAGIYDLVGLSARRNGEYTRFIEGAYGSNREVWARVSPATFPDNFKDRWSEGVYSLLAHSPADRLIDGPEIDAMSAKLVRDDIETFVVRNLVGGHDFVWQDGAQIASLVSRVLTRLPPAHELL